MFKSDWEKTSVTHQLPADVIAKMVRAAYPDKKLISQELISGGCANLNFKIQLEGESQPLILRVYLRDKDSVYREEKISTLLKKTIPIPLTHCIGNLKNNYFAITEFIHGTTLRNLLLSDTPHDLGKLMCEIGVILSRITAYRFSKTGFFDKNLNVIPCATSDIIKLMQSYLIHKTALSVLSPDTISEIRGVLEKCRHLFPLEDKNHLVHGDFDPANILVDHLNGTWGVTGILDWEFAFSGSYLWDIANMLRYSHKMPPEFQNAFIEALKNNGIELQDTWKSVIYLLNLSSLLDCLIRSDPHHQPVRCADILNLIKDILSQLNTEPGP